MVHSVQAAYNDVQFLQDTNVYVTSTGITLVAEAGAKVNSITVNSTYIDIVLEKDAGGLSSISLKSNNRYLLTNDRIVNTVCGSNDSSILLKGPDQIGTVTVRVVPSATICVVGSGGAVSSSGGGAGSAGGGGGGSVEPPTAGTPQTTNGTVTATASGGGQTTLTTSDGTITLQVPANTVSADTAFQVAPIAVAQVVGSAPVPGGKILVGNNAYSLSAIEGTSNLTVFTKPITLIFTYTDAQIANLSEDSLKVYRWNGTAWEALSGTVDKTSNTITVTTTKFSYFAIMGEPPSLTTTGTTPTVPTIQKPISQMTKAELRAKIAEIMVLILQLQVELQKMLASAPFSVDLSYGSTRALEVKRMQEFLISKGYLASGLNTGRYYAATQAAVKSLQKTKGLSEPGIFDSATRAAVNTELGLK